MLTKVIVIRVQSCNWKIAEPDVTIELQVIERSWSSLKLVKTFAKSIGLKYMEAGSELPQTMFELFHVHVYYWHFEILVLIFPFLHLAVILLSAALRLSIHISSNQLPWTVSIASWVLSSSFCSKFGLFSVSIFWPLVSISWRLAPSSSSSPPNISSSGGTRCLQ